MTIQLDEDSKQRVKDALIQIQLLCLKTKCRECPLSYSGGRGCMVQSNAPINWEVGSFPDDKLLR